MANTSYSLVGEMLLVPAADIADKDSAINLHGAARKGDDASGKRAGMMVLVDNAGGDIDLMMALGATPTSKWLMLCNTGGSGVTPS